MKKFAVVAAMATAFLGSTAAYAVDLEVTHWWTSAGEAAAVSEFAKIFEAETGNKWVDSALAGSGTGANPVIISRIIGGNPMGATMMNTGRDAEELIQAGLMRDLTDIVADMDIESFYVDPTQLEPCKYEGGLYCLPVNIHSWDWLWLSTKAYEKIGQPVPTNWDEYVASWPALQEAGILPFGLATGWPINGVPGVLMAGIGGADLVLKINRDKDPEAVRSPEFRKVAEAMDSLRKVTAPETMVPSFGDVGNQLLAGEAAGNIHGDWLAGDLQIAGGVPGVDYECLPGLGLGTQLTGGGDSFYFPKLPEGTSQEVLDAQADLARLLISPEAQLKFNMVKGSMPIRTDIDLSGANACMKKAIDLLGNGLLPSGDFSLSSDTQQQLQDLDLEFFADENITVDDYIERRAEIVAQAD
ncbi:MULTISPECIES: ABC transporter substrate-binding protein [unclassified Devosia]|uniref:ABC transporter substrate-binding protein n=1 Tax=unclassified Devosia TaxID=196773 RepID=UPI00145CAC88|nr:MULTISPECIES: ABC transporter substrate-binding protein [unclassified Devosia]MBJ6986959.1 carbohydrate ABC transporter substrate-binding protein [Devosia sp. MC521]MBJ7576667.1 carbohydrate ABC transporter substrate-binding protein [Devosia sp. MC532]MBK1795730.1 carbohydrate ABC transporter substrate-binding protein [Devosia sp. WQ 349K1]QMW63983.1 carbohydrate ABC transporter substrate-binding protein [Devosia sp. MC521]